MLLLVLTPGNCKIIIQAYVYTLSFTLEPKVLCFLHDKEVVTSVSSPHTEKMSLSLIMHV